jgi:hypothetical protein
MKQIQKALRALDVAEDVANIRSRREQWVDGMNQFIFVIKEALPGLCARATARCPWLDAQGVAALPGTFARRAEEMNEIAACTSRRVRPALRHLPD